MLDLSQESHQAQMDSIIVAPRSSYFPLDLRSPRDWTRRFSTPISAGYRSSEFIRKHQVGKHHGIRTDCGLSHTGTFGQAQC